MFTIDILNLWYDSTYEWTPVSRSIDELLSSRLKDSFIIISCRQLGYPWPSIATAPYHSTLRVGPQGYIPYPHRAAGCRFELAVLLLFDHMRGSIGVHHLWAHLWACPACLVRLTWIVFVMGDWWPYSWCFVRYCLHDLFNIARSIFV